MISCLQVPNSTFGQLELLWWEKRHRICRLQLWTNRSKISCNIANIGPQIFFKFSVLQPSTSLYLNLQLEWKPLSMVEQLSTYLVRGSTSWSGMHNFHKRDPYKWWQTCLWAPKWKKKETFYVIQGYLWTRKTEVEYHIEAFFWATLSHQEL